MEGSEIEDNFCMIRDRLLKSSDETMLQYALPDLKAETEQLWTEAKPQIAKAIDEELKKLLVEFGITEKIAMLRKHREEHANDGPSWTFSGNPSEDIRALRNVTAKEMEPEFEKLYKEAGTATKDLWEKCEQLKKTITSLDEELESTTEEIRVITEELVQKTTQNKTEIKTKSNQ